MKNSDFSAFEDIISLYVSCQERQKAWLSEFLVSENTKNDKTPLDEKDWCGTLEELKEQFLNLKQQQYQIAQNFGTISCEKFFEELEKACECSVDSTMQLSPESSVYFYFLKSFAKALDPHTTYFSPKEIDEFIVKIQKKFTGVGLFLEDTGLGYAITAKVENSPASHAEELRLGDRLVAIDGESVISKEKEEVIRQLLGKEDTPVQLTILRSMENSELELEIQLNREKVVIEDKRQEITCIDHEDGVLIVAKIHSLYKDHHSCASSDLCQAIDDLKQTQSIKGIILDLRDNPPGGFLSEALGIAGLLIKKGIVLLKQDSKGTIKYYRNFRNVPIWEGPLAVLINPVTGGSFEIIAQSLQDYGRAVILGDTSTYGKGSVQSHSFDMFRDEPKSRGGYLLTHQLFYTVSGKSPQLTGVLSDIVVPGPLHYSKIGEKHASYSLQNTTRHPHYEDLLTDLSPRKREEIQDSYFRNAQEKLTCYSDLIDQLKENSRLRIENNEEYQAFLNQLKSVEFKGEVSRHDLQLEESLNIMKDLIDAARKDELL